MRHLTTTIALALVFAPLPLHADDSGGPSIPVANPEAKVESVQQSCERRYAGQQLGSLDPATFCEVYAWSEIGQHYPALLEVARELERQYNKRAGELEEARKQLRRERQQTDRLSKQLGKQQAKLDWLEGRVPQWVPYVASAGALLVGGAIGYGVGAF